MRYQSQSTRLPRRGFSLIEIVVVLAILLLLMGIAFVTLGKSGEKARVAATKTTIAQLDVALQARYREFLQDLTEQERKKAKKAEWGNVILAGEILRGGTYSGPGTPVNDVAARSLAKHAFYLGYFPQRWEDTYGFDGLDGNGWIPPAAPAAVPDDSTNDSTPLGPLQKELLAGIDKIPGGGGNINSIDAPSGATPQQITAESAELLYLMLVSGPSGSQLLDKINPKHIGDTDMDGNPEFLDDWGQPLRFYNSPTSLFVTTSPPAQQGAIRAAYFPRQPPTGGDPLDPTRSLIDPTGPTANVVATGGTAGGLTILPFNDTTYYDPNTPYLPLIVSCGPDESLGLIEPADPTVVDRRFLLCEPSATPDAPDEALDNLTNYQGAN